jgi:hypothetical protein
MNPKATIYSQKFVRSSRVFIRMETPVGASGITIGRKMGESEIFREYPRWVCINVVVGETGWPRRLAFCVGNAAVEWVATNRETLAIASRCPKTEGFQPRNWPGTWETSLLFHLCPNFSRSYEMKRIIVALVLALSVVSVVGCGGGTSTPTKK